MFNELLGEIADFADLALDSSHMVFGFQGHGDVSMNLGMEELSPMRFCRELHLCPEAWRCSAVAIPHGMSVDGVGAQIEATVRMVFLDVQQQGSCSG